jgi:hypothetical protein
VDWTVIAIVQHDTTSLLSEEIFTACAYAYMAIALWIYLIVLLYAASFAWYLGKLSRGKGRFRLVFHAPDLPDGLHHFLRRTLVFTVLGYLSAYFMSLQAYYLETPAPNVFHAMFATEIDLFQRWSGGISSPPDYSVAAVTSGWTCWAVFFYAALLFGITLSLLLAALSNAKDNSPSNPRTDTAEDSQAFSYDSFWRYIAPTLTHWLLITVLMVATMARPMIGSLFIVTVLCIVIPIARDWFR